MKPKSIILILISLGFGLVAAIGMSQVMGRNHGSGKETQKRPVLVALMDLDISQELTPENVKIEQWPVELVPEGAASDWKQAENKRLNSRILAGFPILDKMLIDRSKFLSFGIPEGYTVHPIKVTQEGSFHGLLRPGHRVDVLGIFEREENDQKFTRIFLKAVRIFAVNDQTSRAIEEDGKGQAIKTVQVLVTRRQAKLLALAEKVGDIHLLMRSDSDDPGEQDDIAATMENENDEVDLSDLYGEQPQDHSQFQAAVHAATASESSASSIGAGVLGFLGGLGKGRSEAEQAPPVEGPRHVMTVITPDGALSYTWEGDSKLPAVSDAYSPEPSAGFAEQFESYDSDVEEDEPELEDEAELEDQEVEEIEVEDVDTE